LALAAWPPSTSPRLKHDRKVALKVLRPELADVLGADRFVVEIKTTASLQHPHILPLFGSGTADGFRFYVMPYFEGETLRDKLDRETQFGIEEAVRITTEVADAHDYAHRRGVIHRETGDAITDIWSFDPTSRPVVGRRETRGTTWYGDPALSRWPPGLLLPRRRPRGQRVRAGPGDRDGRSPHRTATPGRQRDAARQATDAVSRTVTARNAGRVSSTSSFRHARSSASRQPSRPAP
jgi:hypothetical protein